MKSKSYDFTKNTSKTEKINKTESFLYLYNSSTEKFKLSEDPCAQIDHKDINSNDPYGNEAEKSIGKKNKKIKVKLNKSGKYDIDKDNNLNALNETLPYSFTLSSKITSTPNTSSIIGSNVKSIIKQDEIETSIIERTPGVSKKKRNKSVSFVVDINEEVVDKKVKCEDRVSLLSGNNKSNIHDPQNLIPLKVKKEAKKSKKESSPKNNKIKSGNKTIDEIENNTERLDSNDISDNKDEKKGNKKKNKQIKMEIQNKSSQSINKNKISKNKNKGKDVEVGTNGVYKPLSTVVENKNLEKHNNKHKTIESVTTEGEPEPKNRKKNITDGLENLKIGENAHTLTDLIEMTVVDKDTNKNNKKSKRTKVNSENSEPTLEHIEEAKEKIKWTKRKWNKDKKGEITDDGLFTSVIVENLPLKIMATYRKLLTEHFNKYGQIKKIGPSEIYPGEEQIPSFASTVYFMTEESATEALKEDKCEFEGGLLSVRRPLPATLSTVVVRSHAALNHKEICAAFSGCGRIRHIRPIQKGKKSMSTVFVEFVNTKGVEKARKTAEDAKIGGKKIFVSNFVVRGRKDVPNPGGNQNTD